MAKVDPFKRFRRKINQVHREYLFGPFQFLTGRDDQGFCAIYFKPRGGGDERSLTADQENGANLQILTLRAGSLLKFEAQHFKTHRWSDGVHIRDVDSAVSKWRAAASSSSDPLIAEEWIPRVYPELVERVHQESTKRQKPDWAKSFPDAVRMIRKDLNTAFSESAAKRAWDFRIPDSRDLARSLILQRCPRVAELARQKTGP